MLPETIVDRLAALPVFESVPRNELEWLAARGELRSILVAPAERGQGISRHLLAAFHHAAEGDAELG